MADHAKFAATATRLIAKHGRPVTYVELDSTPTDSDKPWKGAGEQRAKETFQDVMSVFVASSSDLGKLIKDEELLKRVDQVALITPIAGIDLCHIAKEADGSTWKLDWIQELKPADLTLLYIAGVKR